MIHVRPSSHSILIFCHLAEKSCNNVESFLHSTYSDYKFLSYQEKKNGHISLLQEAILNTYKMHYGCFLFQQNQIDLIFYISTKCLNNETKSN